MSELEDSMTTYHQIAEAIGQVCFWWTAIEDHVADVCLHAAACIEHSLSENAGWDIMLIMMLNQSDRERFATAKALVHMIGDEAIYRKCEKIINHIDNDLRPERNSYVHGAWDVQDGSIVRRRVSVRVLRPQSRKTELKHYNEVPFSDVDQVRRFVDQLETAYHDLSDLDAAIAGHGTTPCG